MGWQQRGQTAGGATKNVGVGLAEIWPVDDTHRALTPDGPLAVLGRFHCIPPAGRGYA